MSRSFHSPPGQGSRKFQLSCCALKPRPLVCSDSKGTLTGVVDRLEQRGVVERLANESDRRSSIVRLTARGETLFGRVFPEHIAHCRRAFANWNAADFEALDEQLGRLRAALDAHGGRQRDD